MARPRPHRIRRTLEFAAVRQQGRSWKGRHVTIGLLPLENGPPRAGFAVTRRVGNAVTRNLVRRRLQAILALSLADVPHPCLVVTIPRPSAAAVPFSELAADWKKTARRAGLLPATSA